MAGTMAILSWWFGLCGVEPVVLSTKSSPELQVWYHNHVCVYEHRTSTDAGFVCGFLLAPRIAPNLEIGAWKSENPCVCFFAKGN